MLELSKNEMIKKIEELANQIISENDYSFMVGEVSHRVEHGGNFYAVENEANLDPRNDYIAIDDTMYIDEGELKEVIKNSFIEYYEYH